MDKVIHPMKKSGGGDVAKDSNSGAVKGPKPSMSNLTPFNRSGKKGK
jgi:hypothetical protein